MKNMLKKFWMVPVIALVIFPTEGFSMAKQPRGQKTAAAPNPTPLPSPSSRDMQINSGEIQPASQKTNE